MELSRRRLLATAASGLGIGLLAGCVGDADGSGDGSRDADGGADRSTVRASFFVFGDVAAAVAGDAVDTESLVPIGQHGHGWEPGPRVREEIHGADLLLHGAEGFQPWMDTILTDIDADGSDVTTVDVSAAVDLLGASDDHSHTDGDDHAGEPIDEDHAHSEEEHTDDGHGDDEHHDDTDDGHESPVDPHFWMDPVRLGNSVETVRDGLVDVDSEHADTYATNAEAFRERLDSLHGRIESVVDGAATDVLLVAGHNSFRYFRDRYGIEIESLTGVSPDDRPTARDIEQAQHAIETHGLKYICADPLESQQAATQLLEETDAEDVLPLTAMPGMTDEWVEDGWGYLDVMEQVNVPTLERALGAT
ncbi:metal ABC transporter solute-binding protein, Zn/Mn family [Halobellus sp. GM3]|uniref:metal ABC transporter solute-binding protein, Zn/Mn family n=1 Tax=Halobellus sp. GM3 TaxID=3458410 RepID=UPI00403D79CA